MLLWAQQLLVTIAGEEVRVIRSSSFETLSVEWKLQHPLHASPHSHTPSLHPQSPPQHSLGRSTTRPNAFAAAGSVKSCVLYTTTLVGSNPGRAALLSKERFGGRGRAAARSKNWSMTREDFAEDSRGWKEGDNEEEEGSGNSIPAALSTQCGQAPSAQSSDSLEACSFPRCSTHPGHWHW